MSSKQRNRERRAEREAELYAPPPPPTPIQALRSRLWEFMIDPELQSWLDDLIDVVEGRPWV